MVDTIRYVRVTPYNKATGALARRVTLGGKLFLSGEWYQMSVDKANKLIPLKQNTGAPYFEVLTPAEFQTKSKEELLAAMVAAGIKGLAFQNPVADTVVRPDVDRKRKKSDFEGFDEGVVDVDLSKQQMATQAQVHETLKDAMVEDDAQDINLNSMSRQELVDLCEDNGIDVSGPVKTKDALKKLLRAQGIG